MYKNICLIPAKGASTRLPGKNLLKINGRELVSYGITAALASELFDGEVYVSTESEEIKAVAESYGARVPFLRSEKLAVDPAGVADVALDFLDKLPNADSYENLFIILPTSPLIEAKDLIGAYTEYRNTGTHVLMSVSENEHNSHRSVLIKDGKLEPLFKDKMRMKSQELEPTYYLNGAVTILNISEFKKRGTYFFYPISVYTIPRERGVDIDTELDYLWAKFLMEGTNNTW